MAALLAATVCAYGCGPPAAPSSADDHYLELPAEQQAALTARIQAEGFNCPAVKTAQAMGQDVHGKFMRVRCGPAGSPGVYPELVYRVTFTPNGAVTVAPWK